MIDFDKWEVNRLAKYTGRSCKKLGLFDKNNEPWMLKIQDNITDKIPNSDLVYSNSPITEYISSMIYKLCGFDVHEVLLGYRSGKIAVACKDFTYPSKTLLEIANYKMNCEDYGSDSVKSIFLIDMDVQINFISILESSIPGITERFWDMFIMDDIIGNGDRTDNNWGLLAYDSNNIKLAPIYDNGAGLCPNWSEAKMNRFLSTKDKSNFISKVRTCCFYKGSRKQINPYKFIAETTNSDCNNSALKVLNLIRNIDYVGLIDSVPCLSDTHREFYKTLIKFRLEWLSETVKWKLNNMNLFLDIRKGECLHEENYYNVINRCHISFNRSSLYCECKHCLF